MKKKRKTETTKNNHHGATTLWSSTSGMEGGWFYTTALSLRVFWSSSPLWLRIYKRRWQRWQPRRNWLLTGRLSFCWGSLILNGLLSASPALSEAASPRWSCWASRFGKRSPCWLCSREPPLCRDLASLWVCSCLFPVDSSQLRTPLHTWVHVREIVLSRCAIAYLIAVEGVMRFIDVGVGGVHCNQSYHLCSHLSKISVMHLQLNKGIE